MFYLFSYQDILHEVIIELCWEAIRTIIYKVGYGYNFDIPYFETSDRFETGIPAILDLGDVLSYLH